MRLLACLVYIPSLSHPHTHRHPPTAYIYIYIYIYTPARFQSPNLFLSIPIAMGNMWRRMCHPPEQAHTRYPPPSVQYCRHCGALLPTNAKVCKRCAFVVSKGSVHPHVPKRGWALFPGANYFYCDGLFLSAPDIRVLFLTWVLVIGVTAIFFVFDAPFLWHHVSPACPIIAAVLILYTLRMFFLVTTTGVRAKQPLPPPTLS